MIQKALMPVFFLALTQSICYADYFSASLNEADWDVKKGSASCQLQQHIPLYGTANFSHHSGQLLRFSIEEQRFKPEIVKASLTIDSPGWIHDSTHEKDYLVYLEQSGNAQNYPRLSVYGDTAEKMLDVLLQGLEPTFTYVRASVTGLSAETNVAVSSINFSKKYLQFADCRKNFLPNGFKAILAKSLFFRMSSKRLNNTIIEQLKNTARYIKAVKGSKVVIVSDTAKVGKRDKAWFLKRANFISARLKKLGVAKNKIIIKTGINVATKNNKIVQLRVFGPDSLKAIYYSKGNTKLTYLEKQRLDLLVQYAQGFLPNSRLVIKSHTDSKGKKLRNLKISQKRGDEIKRYLISKGIEKNRVGVKAFGESKPARSNRFPKGRAQNRRVIIDFVG